MGEGVFVSVVSYDWEGGSVSRRDCRCPLGDEPLEGWERVFWVGESVLVDARGTSGFSCCLGISSS